MPTLKDIQWMDLKSISDTRGVLTAIESEIDIPIEIKRIFYMHHVTDDRGGHAHLETDQLIIAISGSFKVELYDGFEKKEYFLNDPTKGLYVPRMIFLNLMNFTKDAVCMVLANTHYEENEYIRNIDDYIKIISTKK
jgi:dTDP-4-dehydrorhamnose 3,5-epimerase-like enzyme